LITRDKWIRL